MSERVEPLGPAWEAPLGAAELRKLCEGLPSLMPACPESAALGEHCSLIALTEAGSALASDATSAKSVCAIGAFDGVHAGHRELISATCAEARERGLASVAVTFSCDPSEVVPGAKPQAELLTVADRIRVVASLGVDAVLVLNFTREMASMPHTGFVSDVLVPAIHPVSIHVGSDFRMGAKGAGTVEAMAAYGAGLGIAVTGHSLVELAGSRVSATRVRALVGEGKVGAAAELLRRCHFVRGTVEHGRGEGTSFGFPTANVHVSPKCCLPAEGVYAAIVTSGDSAWPAAVNVGAPRSFGGEAGAPLIEATLVGFSGDLYGTELGVAFVAWLREPRRFATLEELERTVLGNVEWVRTYLGEGELS